jgi:hypothetical protein
MDFHEYVTGRLIQDTLAERRADAARERLYEVGRTPRPSLRLRVGSVLIRLGSRLLGADSATNLKTSYRGA